MQEKIKLKITQIEEESIECFSCIQADYPNLNDKNKVPIWFGLEFITDTISLLTIKNVESSDIILSASKIEYLAESFKLGQKIIIEAKKVHEKDGIKLFEGKVIDKESSKLLVSAFIKTTAAFEASLANV
ncbi:MAG: hypothetical protein KDD56_01395 [Bdellovibrionales bacterium]|nr:hypothetical protein [Bdellovibrionales bacterium]